MLCCCKKLKIHFCVLYIIFRSHSQVFFHEIFHNIKKFRIEMFKFYLQLTHITQKRSDVIWYDQQFCFNAYFVVWWWNLLMFVFMYIEERLTFILNFINLNAYLIYHPLKILYRQNKFKMVEIFLNWLLFRMCD